MLIYLVNIYSLLELTFTIIHKCIYASCHRVPLGEFNYVAINFIVKLFHSQQQARGRRVREQLAEGWCKELLESATDPDSLFVLPTTNQILGLHTFIRCTDKARNEFIFYSKRFIRLLIEYASSLLPFQDVVVDNQYLWFQHSLSWRNHGTSPERSV